MRASRRPQSDQVLGEPGERALGAELGARLVVARALLADEAVAGRIDVDVAVRPLLADDLDVRHRDRLVLLAEMQLGRYLRLLVGILGDLPAVEADRRRQPLELAG